MRYSAMLLLASCCCALVTNVTTSRDPHRAWANYSTPFSSLAGRTLRVAFIPYSYAVKVDSACGCSEFESCVGCEWSGVVIEVYTEIQQRANFSIQETLVSPEALARFDNYSYDACVDDVATGRLDLCLSTFWPWDHRLRVAQFAPFGADSIGLVVPLVAEKSNGLGSEAWTWLFDPVDASVWFTFLGVTVMTAVTLFLTEGGCERTGSHQLEQTHPDHKVSPLKMRHGSKVLTDAQNFLNAQRSSGSFGEAIDEVDADDLGEILKPGLLTMMSQGEEAHGEGMRSCHYWGPSGHLGVCIKRLSRVLYAVFLAMLSSGGNLHGDDAKPRSLGGKFVVLVSR